MSREFADVPAMLRALTPSYPVFCLRPHVIAEAARRFLELFPVQIAGAEGLNPASADLARGPESAFFLVPRASLGYIRARRRGAATRDGA